METIGQRIKALREAQHWSQAKLAATVGTSTTYIGHWETGYRKPSTEWCIKLADVFGVTLDELIRGEASPNALGRALIGSIEARDPVAGAA